MSDVAIKVEGLGKRYRLGAQRQSYGSLRDSLAGLGNRFLPSGKDARAARKPEFWALKDVNFEVKRGEVLGIIGRNGAGKSTLLKLLSEITEPTEGRITMNGRVASLLEVGTGFHPELSGRENIFLNAAILGMTKVEITSKFDEIVAFAEVERFIDTQVKHYSSGMYLRLAFAVAAHLEPEILVVDEVLAVGDAQFQKKCLGKMNAISKGGRTVLFVSHDMAAINAICNTGMMLKSGQIVVQGTATLAVAEYLRQTDISNEFDTSRVLARSGLFSIQHASVAPTSEPQHVIFPGSTVVVEIVIDVTQYVVGASLELILRDMNSSAIAFSSFGSLDGMHHNLEAGLYRLRCSLQLPYLAEGPYSFDVLAVNAGVKVLDHLESCVSFHVTGVPLTRTGWIHKQSINRGVLAVTAQDYKMDRLN